MATLIYNGDLTVLSSKIVKTLKNRSCGTEDIASRCCTTRDSVRQILHRLKKRELVEHDGRRPRTWKLKETEATQAARAHEPTPKYYDRWEPAEDEAMARMFWAGATYAAIADRLGRTVWAVESRCRTMGMSYEVAYGLSGPEAA